MNPAARDYLKYQAPVILWGLCIFAVSSLPRMAPLKGVVPHLDKVAHGIEYFVFGYLLARAFHYAGRITIRRKAVRLALILAVLFAALDELHQMFVPTRVESIADFMADVTGIGIALGLFHVRHRRRDKGGTGVRSAAGGEEHQPGGGEVDVDGIAGL